MLNLYPMPPITKKGRVIAFDFDGVVAKYNGFVSPDDVQEPIAETIKAMRLLKEKGYRILIHSTRGNKFLKDYCERFAIPVDFINRNPEMKGENPGKPIAWVYVDDRSVLYTGQSAETLVSEIENFKAYWQTD
jgi:hydroxymethylpyrimidine pyrophosphatase-like HAD family hydrolase